MPTAEPSRPARISGRGGWYTAAMVHRLRGAFVVMAVSAAMLALAACGGSSSSTVSPAQFSARLGTLCGQINRAARPVSTDAAKFAVLINQYLPKFRAITPPPSLKATYSQYVSLLSQLATALQTRNAGELRQVVTQARALTAKLGAPECGR